MRKGFLILLGVLVPTVSTGAQDLREALEHFDAAKEAVESGRYTEALASFDSSLATGFENAALHYNKGVAFYRLDQLGRAVASFERARRLAPEDRTIHHNLTMAQSRIRDQISELPASPGAVIRRQLSRTLGATALFIIGLAGYLVWCGLTLIRIRSRRYSDWMRRGSWASAAVGALGIFLGFLVSVRPADPPAAVVVAQEAPVFPSAAATDDPDLEIHEGLTVNVIGRSGEWTAVRLPNGVTGWVSTDLLVDV